MANKHKQANLLKIYLESGYIAISSVLVIAAIVVVIGITISLSSISEGQMSLGLEQNEKTVFFIEACIEEALLKLNNDKSTFSSLTSITLPEGTCTISNISNTTLDWSFRMSGQVSSHTKTFDVEVTRNADFDVTTWKEV